jgi:DNA-binding PadR family transcriptional regulator
MAGARRQFFQHGELALVVLALVARRPMHGYELLGELARLLRPAYEPSPGGVYPALAALVAEELLAADGDGGRRRTYRITARGRALLRERRSAVRSFEVRTGVRVGADDVHEAIGRFAARVEAVAERLDLDEVEAELDRVASELEARARPARRTSRVR